MQVPEIPHEINDTALSAKSMNIEHTHKSVDLSFRNIEYSVIDNKGQRRDILKNIDGFCPGGEVTAILGASGAGKTSLLNILACRVAKKRNVTLSGKVMANLQEYDADRFSSFAAYVMQNDVLFETFSPREAFYFVASLKYADQIERIHQVEYVIKTMKLQGCQNALIGGITFKGISGGERKRTSIGFELVTNPSAILLDEPTSGLDSFTAFQIIYELTNLAHNHQRTIVFTIHQPSSDIYTLFDRVMLLVSGRFIYQGQRQQLVNYFKQIGFECPPLSNPMDYMMSIMHSESQDNIDNFNLLFDQYNIHQEKYVLQEINESSRADLVYKKIETSLLHQVKLITNRAFKGLFRDKLIIRQRFGSAIFIGLLVGGAFWGIGENTGTFSAYQSVAGCIFLLCMNLTMASLFPVVLQFSTERDVFLREENSKLYTTLSYFLGKSLIDVPFCLLAPIIQQMILYWMVDLNYHDAGVVITHLFIAILTCLNGNSIGLMAGCAFNDIKVATSIIPLFLMPLTIFSGFLANSKQFYAWIGWIKYISPMKYSFEALARNEFDGRHYIFGDPIQVLGFDIGLWESVGVLIGLAIVIRMFGFFFLYILRSKQQ